ncbi:hypothetical protein JCM14713_01030 [Desulfomicrobium salsuginis]
MVRQGDGLEAGPHGCGDEFRGAEGAVGGGGVGMQIYFSHGYGVRQVLRDDKAEVDNKKPARTGKARAGNSCAGDYLKR